MMSETEILEEGSVIGIGDKCEMDTTSHQDLSLPDCNGSSDHNQANDLDNSYVFVTGSDGHSDDAVGDMDLVAEENAAMVGDRREEIFSQSEKLDAVTEEVDEGRTGSVEPRNGNPPVENDFTRMDESSDVREHGVEASVGDDLEERTDKRSAEPEAKLVEDPDVKNPSFAGVAVEGVGNQNGEIRSLAEPEKYDDVIKSESAPAALENQESQVGSSELASESPENVDLNIVTLRTPSCDEAKGGSDNQGTNDECNNQINLGSAEELQANQGSQVEAVNVIECESQDVHSVAKEEEILDREVVETAGRELVPSTSMELDTELHKIDSKEEVHNEEAMRTMSLDVHEHQQLDTGLENNSVSEQRAETETVVSNTDHHVESVCDLILEEKSEESFASHVGSGIQHAEETEKCPDRSATPHETMHAESSTDASLPTKCHLASSAHSPQSESEISDTAVIETVSSLPLDGTVSQVIENGDDSWIGGTTIATCSGSGSEINGVVLAESKPDGVLTEKEPAFQDGEAPAEAATGLSEAADSQPDKTDVELEPEVHVHNYSAISNGEGTDAASGRTEVLDNFNVVNETEPNTLLEQEGAQTIGDQLDGPAGDSHEKVFLQGKEAPGNSETLDVISEPGIHVHDTSSSEGRTDAVSATCRTELLDSSKTENKCVANTALESGDVQNTGGQLDGAAVGSLENMPLQENEATENSDAFNLNVKPGVDVLNFSATGSEEKAGAASGTCRMDVLNSIDVFNEGVANSGVETEDVQCKGDDLICAPGDIHEKVVLQENHLAGNSETFDAKLEPGVHVHGFAAISSGEKTDVVSPACRTEVSDKFNVDDESVANTELETDELQNIGDKNVDGTAGGNDSNLTSQENEATRKSGSNDISGAESEGSISSTILREEPSVKAKTKPFNFLVRVPRFDVDNLREQIRLAKLYVDEKTKIRDAVQVQIQEKRASSQIHGVDYEFAKGEGRSARKLVRSKRMEIDSLQSMINKAKNALSIDDIDIQIQNMEHMIQHETLPLKEEKQLIREIKQLKQLREQLSSNLGSQDEIKQAIEQREEVEDRLKILRKELDILKDQVLKAEAAAMEAGKRYDDENKKVRELQAQFRAADDIRQSAYAQLQSLRKELSKKNEHFFKYKDAAAVASNHAFSGNTDALYCLCMENVKNFMNLWNSDNEFRKEYLRSNARSTVRRLGTLDGRSLGPDEQPVILPSYVNKRVGNVVPASVEVDDASPIPTPEVKQETAVKTVVSDGKSMQKVTEHKNQKVASGVTAGPVTENGYDRVSRWGDVADEVQDKPKKSAEEIESMRKAEEMRKEETEAKLKEQRRLEALAKANEARERKKRRAENLQMRAELKIQKEAEQKEKEREKRLRKKERKKAASTDVNDANHNSETAPSSESAPEISRDTEVKEMPAATPKKQQKRWSFTKQSKSKTIPPPLRGRNKRKLLQQWMWVGVACLLILFLFWMGNVSLFSNNMPKRRNPIH